MTTVFRLPPEPPVGTTVRPEPDDGTRWTRTDHPGWRMDANGRGGGIGVHWSWCAVLGHPAHIHPGGVVVVEPDPHPTPWVADGFGVINDARGGLVGAAHAGAIREIREALARRIVDAVNKAATT